MTRRPDPAPRLDLLETCWQLRTPHGRIVTCGIYRTDAPGVELRAGFGDEDLLRSQRTREIQSARELTDTWRRAVLAKGGFVTI